MKQDVLAILFEPLYKRTFALFTWFWVFSEFSIASSKTKVSSKTQVCKIFSLKMVYSENYIYGSDYWNANWDVHEYANQNRIYRSKHKSTEIQKDQDWLKTKISRIRIVWIRRKPFVWF